MLNRVKLSYFQQHRNLEVKLGPGLTAIRGANEAGKSSLLRGICYALFGAKAMPAPLDELVTWGEEVRKLRAEVEFTSEGIVYTVTRGKSGAEVNYTDANGEAQKVTGQNEVTAFVSRVLRVDATAAPRLMLSNQNEIRGALEAGPKETTALIERLSEFDQIDGLIELMQERLTLGATTSVEAAIELAHQQLVEAEKKAVAPDLEALDLAISKAQNDLEAAAGDLGDAQERLEAAQGKLNDAKVAAAERQALVNAANAASQRCLDIRAEIQPLLLVQAPDNVEAEIQRRRDAIAAEERRAELQRKKDRIEEIGAEVAKLREVGVPKGDVAALRAQIEAERDRAELQRKFDLVAPHMADHEVRALEGFETTPEQLDADIERAAAEIVEMQRKVAKCHADAALLRQQITNGACGFCGQDFSDVPAVKAKNAELEAKAHVLLTEAETLGRDIEIAQQALEHAKEVREWSKPALKALAVVGDLARPIDGVLPPVLEWLGPDLPEQSADIPALEKEIAAIEAGWRAYERAQARIATLLEEHDRLVDELPATLPPPADTRALKREIRELEAAQAQYTAAQARLGALNGELERLGSQMAAYAASLEKLPPVDLTPLQEAERDARAALPPARAAVEAAQNRLQAAKQAHRDAEAEYLRAVAAMNAAEEALAQRRRELHDLKFNNKLLKDVRAARPIIADKLWNMVLAAVSRYFSEMRGRESVVTKGQNGFMVDGVVVSPVSLSGSALDILGLAIRVALVKTFLPACPFFVLDEPAQGCDDNRTANLLSFLSACGFQQVLLVTHEDTSESVAQNMITIGA